MEERVHQPGVGYRGYYRGCTAGAEDRKGGGRCSIGRTPAGLVSISSLPPPGNEATNPFDDAGVNEQPQPRPVRQPSCEQAPLPPLLLLLRTAAVAAASGLIATIGSSSNSANPAARASAN
ncbi:hypothetical protein MTO96_000049 [Rhipicephalus appendiculatus]